MYVTIIILVYCINNYSLTVGFQIPQYNSTFTDTVTSGNYSVTSSNPQFTSYVANCAGTIEIGITGNEQATDICNFQLLSIVYPATPYAQVFDSYALSQAVSFKEYLSLICDYMHLVDSAIKPYSHVIMIHC